MVLTRTRWPNIWMMKGRKYENRIQIKHLTRWSNAEKKLLNFCSIYVTVVVLSIISREKCATSCLLCIRYFETVAKFLRSLKCMVNVMFSRRLEVISIRSFPTHHFCRQLIFAENFHGKSVLYTWTVYT